MCEPRHSERDVDGARRRGIILQERHAAESREPTVTIRGADSRQDQLPPRVKHVSLLQEQLRVHENAVRPSPSRSARGKPPPDSKPGGALARQAAHRGRRVCDGSGGRGERGPGLVPHGGLVRRRQASWQRRRDSQRLSEIEGD